MSYPVEVAGSGLYEKTTSPKNTLGAVANFPDSSGRMLLARYMKNDAGATLAAGNLVSYATNGDGHIGGIYVANAPYQCIAGGMATSLATNEYGWVIFRGVQTNVSASATQDSAAGARAFIPNAGGITTAALTFASNWRSAVMGLVGTASLATGAVNTVTWLWK